MMLTVELGRGVEVVVVGGQTGIAERVGLLLGQHAERAARLHAQTANHPHHLEHAFELRTVGHVAPGGAHAEARRALLAGTRRRLGHLVE